LGRVVVLGYAGAMRPRFYPSLVNDRFGDPAVFVDFLLERRAVLLDLGDIAALPARSVLRLTDVFVSHAHMDHFVGFDRLLRLLVGRDKRLRLFGPPGFIDRVEAKLAAYTWNLADRFRTDLVFIVTEVSGDGSAGRARFRLKTGFAREAEASPAVAGGLLVDEPSLSVRYAGLDHQTPCLAFAVSEPEHVNIWRNRLDELGLAVGPWLSTLKGAVFRRLPDDTPIEVGAGEGGSLPLGLLREKVVSVTPGQKLAYVTDAADSPANRGAIVDLARGADILFIETVFPQADAAFAADRAHLTAAQAGELARLAGVGRIEPFHISPRYAGQEARILAEAEEAFRGRQAFRR
jgi:ribonuclease Z